ncbi:uncharacterized protein LOC126686763 [Mercurialis annua]|uniref:uncharacterized protein LOC126686763 n=1 Tax=Mercurialis annua TaxID=3986 RepID=UPI0021602E59|nr:uncharacterized protein LOC126686763 [Mercurialis annua]
MNNQNHPKTQGHDSHGVHVCSKCGWSFPNPHPSAKQRRSHRKICGSIDGFKLPVHSDNSTHSAISDDEHQSDEDHKTPSPRVLMRSSSEMGSGARGDRSGRSEDEVFTDAVAEFTDSGSGKGPEESSGDVKKRETYADTVAEKDFRTYFSFEDAAFSDTVTPSSNSAHSSHMQNTEVQAMSGSTQDSKTPVLNTAIDFMERSSSDIKTGESVYESCDDRGHSSFDLNPIHLELQADELPNKIEKTGSNDAPETDAKGNEKTENKKIETDTKVIEERNLDSDVGEATETISELGKPDDKDSDSEPDAGAVQSKENVLSYELHSGELSNSSIHASQIKVDAVEGVASGGSVDLGEPSNGEEIKSENFRVFSVPDDIPVVENAEAMIVGFKDLRGGRLPQLVNVDSLDLGNEVEQSVVKDNVSTFDSNQIEGIDASVSDMHVMEGNFEHMDKNEEHIVEKVPDETDIETRQDNVTINENQKTETCAPGIEVEKITLQYPEEELPDGKSSSQEKSLEHSKEFLVDMDPVAATMVEVRQITNINSVGDAAVGDDAKSRAGKCDIVENDRVKIVEDERYPENVMATSEEGKVESYNASETETEEVNSTSGSMVGNLVKTTPEPVKNLQEDDVIPEIISGRNLSESECIQLSGASDKQEGLKELETNNNKTAQMEGASSINAAAECGNNGNNDEFLKSSDSVGVIEVLYKSSDKIDDVEILQNETAQVEGAGSVNAAAESGNNGDNDELLKSTDKVGVVEVLQHKTSDKIDDVEILQKSSEEHAKEEPQHSSADATSSIQNCPHVGDNHASGIASENQSQLFPEDGENTTVTQQLGLSTTDLSVDSSSQTDSLEGHWGSVSVLSTQSDMPAIVDAELLATNGLKASAAEAEITDSKKQQAFPEGQQQSDKSDMVEAPSFMTLVEPRDGDKAAASEIQTVQAKAVASQAGWFPSLTHVVNESQGRKKNEEIIAKVTNWSTGKQHTPLKNLLGEAAVAKAETKFKLQNAIEDPAPVVQKDETKVKDGSASPAISANSPVSAKTTVAESIKKDAGREWNSPARYPADIKREKKKVKGKPYWAQFVCCSSVK